MIPMRNAKVTHRNRFCVFWYSIAFLRLDLLYRVLAPSSRIESYQLIGIGGLHLIGPRLRAWSNDGTWTFDTGPVSILIKYLVARAPGHFTINDAGAMRVTDDSPRNDSLASLFFLPTPLFRQRRPSVFFPSFYFPFHFFLGTVDSVFPSGGRLR